jgi:hypothetical protein
VQVLNAFKLPLAKVSGGCLRKHILPELLKACLRTKSGAVRCGVLTNVAALADRLTEQESAAVIRMLAQVTSVDKSPATLQSTLKVCCWPAHSLLFASFCMKLTKLFATKLLHTIFLQLEPEHLLWQLDNLALFLS